MTRMIGDLIADPVCKPTSEARVRALEDRLGVPLPEPYRAFLLTHNGGYFTPVVIADVADRDLRDELPLLSLFGLCAGSGSDNDNLASIEEALRMYSDSSRIMSCFLPIGDDELDDIICLKITGPDRGSIFAWIYEDEQEPEDVDAQNEDGWANMYHLAPDFDAFVAKLRFEKWED